MKLLVKERLARYLTLHNPNYERKIHFMPLDIHIIHQLRVKQVIVLNDNIKISL